MDKPSMFNNRISYGSLWLIFLSLLVPHTKQLWANEYDSLIAQEQETQKRPEFIINDIIVEGNKYVPKEAIINQVPEQLAVGNIFNPLYTSTLIRNMYGLGYFKQIHLLGEELSNNRINLIVVVDEKKRLDGIEFRGNKKISEETIRKKIKFDKTAIDKEELQKYVNELLKLYQEKDYHSVTITPELEESDDTAKAIFNIEENHRSFIKRVFFKGNKKICSRVLRKAIFTRENWLLSFIDKAGTYQPEAIEMDRHGLENFYQNNGYLNAKVTKIDVVREPNSNHYLVTFHVQEGDQYKISEVTAQGHEQINEEKLLQRIPTHVGDVFSREKLTKSIEIIRLLWGEFGYAFADVYPSVIPDDTNKTVAISFRSDLGDKVKLNRLNIKGNNKTRDKIIRRQLIINEGDLLTSRRMDDSKNKVELLGYFDRKDGVNWKVSRVADDLADLDLMVKEVKTGRAGFRAGLGVPSRSRAGSINSSFSVGGGISDTNLFGKGLFATLNGDWSKEEQSFVLSVGDPWLFDKPIRGSFDLSYAKANYSDQIGSVTNPVAERIFSTALGLGAYYPIWLIGPTTFLCQVGLEKRDLQRRPQASSSLPPVERQEYQGILDRRFFTGNMSRFMISAAQDARNHPEHPSRGYQWAFATKVGMSDKTCNFGFVRVELDASWYTPLIDEHTLYLGLHGNAGFVRPIHDRNIPFDELFHIGGPTTVRGFLWGEVGPRWKGSTTPGLGESIGGTNAFSWNIELIFPIAKDFTIKGAVFYDGGAAWKTPDASCIAPQRLLNNRFSYRHTVGISARLLKPTPMSIAWGFKLNPKKKLGEKVSEVHFSMFREF